MPISAERVVAVGEDDLLHAVPTIASVPKAPGAAVCGAPWTTFAAETLGSVGKDDREVLAIMVWPPYAEEGGKRRCPTCYADTGRPRPARARSTKHIYMSMKGDPTAPTFGVRTSK